jgi:hypothetical protein
MPMTADPVLGRARRTEKDIAKQETEEWLRLHLPDWLDNMVRRLFLEIENQLKHVEKSDAPQNAGDEERHARTLASLERTLERLTQLEKQRSVVRQAQKMKGTDVKAELQRRVAQAIARENAERNFGKSEP